MHLTIVISKIFSDDMTNQTDKLRFIQWSILFLIIYYLIPTIDAKSKTLLTDTDDDKRVFDRNFGSNKNYQINDCIPLAFGDFNADKIVDIFCRNTQGNQIRVMLNDDRTPVTTQQYSVNITGIVSDILAADYDGDSKLDLFVLYKYNSNENVYHGGFLWGDREKLSKKICFSEDNY